MAFVFYDLNDDQNPLNGHTLRDKTEVLSVISQIQKRPPSMFQLQMNDGSRIDVGVSKMFGCVQFTASENNPPYKIRAIERRSHGLIIA